MLSIYKSILINSVIVFDIAFTNVETTSGTDFVSAWRNVENSTSDVVSYSTSDQLYFNVDPQLCSGIEMLAG